VEQSAASTLGNESLPMLSVIVPIYNSTVQLKRCLAALAQSRNANFEVIVVDDGSTEPVAPLVLDAGFRYVRLEGPMGPARARNHGAEIARGQYLAFIDADVCVQPDTLACMAQVLGNDDQWDAVIGTYDDEPDDDGLISQFKNLIHSYVHRSCAGPINSFWSGCGAMRRDIFQKAGGFDARLFPRPSIEDMELGFRISAQGNRILLDGRIRATHLKRWTLWNLLRTDIFDRGIPWIRLMWCHRNAKNLLNDKTSQRISILLTYLAAVAVLSAGLYPVACLLAPPSALIVTALNLDFYRFFARRRGFWRTLAIMPLHWLYFYSCGFCVVAGTAQHFLLDRHRARQPVIPHPGRNQTDLVHHC
jgi:GT2 family glycosyltransferase